MVDKILHNIKYKIGVIILTGLIFSCTSKLKKKYYDSGELKETFQLVDGKKNGIDNKYYKNGQLLNTINWKDGYRNGLAKNYFESGEIKSVYSFLNDLQEGKSTIFYKNGGKKQELHFVKDEVTGPVRDYFENGELKFASLFSKDTAYLVGEFNKNAAAGEDFFIDIITPDSIFMGQDADINIILYNKDFFGRCDLLKGEFIEDGNRIVINERLFIKGNNILVNLPTDKKGFNYWSGMIECTSKEDSTKYAPYPIRFSYYVR
jgi:antitoxin component YwqK of YwqJK toxin-antitoxin module